MLNVDYSVASQPRRFVDKINKLAHLFLEEGKSDFYFHYRRTRSVNRVSLYCCTLWKCFANICRTFRQHTHALSLFRSYPGMSVSRRGVTWFVRILDLVRRVVLANTAINVNASSPKWLNRTCAACTTSYGSGTQSDTRLTAAGCYTNTICFSMFCLMVMQSLLPTLRLTWRT